MASKMGRTVKYGKSSYKGARNVKGGKGTSSKGTGTLKAGGRIRK